MGTTVDATAGSFQRDYIPFTLDAAYRDGNCDSYCHVHTLSAHLQHVLQRPQAGYLWRPADSDTAPAHNSNYNYNCNYNGDPNSHDFGYTNSDDDLCTVPGVIADMRESSSVVVSSCQ